MARFTVGLAAVVLTLALATLGVQSALGAFDEVVPVRLVVDGNAGQGLDTFSDVRIRGVTVGAVDDISLGPDGRAVVELALWPDLDLPASTVATIEPLSVFGPKSVELIVDPDDTGPRLQAGDTIAVREPPTELSELIVSATEILEAIDPAQLRTVQRVLAEGLTGRGGSIAQGIDGVDELTLVLADRDATAAALITDLRTLSAELADRGPAATRAARQLRAGLPILTDSEDQLAALLDDTARVSGDVARLLEGSDGDLERLVTGLERATRVLSPRTDDVIRLVVLFEEVFELLADASHITAPDGSRIAGIDAIFNEDLCLVVDGLCEQLPPGAGDLLDLRGPAEILAELTELLRLLPLGGGS